MTTQHNAAYVPTRTLDPALDELRERIITLEIEVAHWERTCRKLSADLRALPPERRPCRTGRTARKSGGQRR